MKEALAQAREARLYVLEKMRETISESRAELSPYAPRMYRIQIPAEKIGIVIGPGGRVIRSIIEETKCTIDVEDDGTVNVGSTSEEMANRAIEIIKGLTKDVEVGTIYTGKVTRLLNFGAFVEIMPGKEGLVHISELADYRVPSVEDVVQVGDEIMVMVTEIDAMGRINLSRRAVLEGSSGPPKPVGTGVPSGSGGAPQRRGGGGYREGPPPGARRRPNGRPGGFESGPRRRRPDRSFDRSSDRPSGPPPPPRPPYGPRRPAR
jgi:polyribonucleotide nucleotidyltransferase